MIITARRVKVKLHSRNIKQKLNLPVVTVITGAACCGRTGDLKRSLGFCKKGQAGLVQQLFKEEIIIRGLETFVV